jgi:hypothetical protein
MKKPFLILCLAFNLFLVKHAQSVEYLKSTDAIKTHSEDVMKYFVQQDYTNMFKLLRKYWVLSEHEIDDFETKTIKQFGMAIVRFGNAIGYKFIKDKKISDVVLNKNYILQCEYYYIRASFIYYKNNEGWRLVSFSWDDKADEMLE